MESNNKEVIYSNYATHIAFTSKAHKLYFH
jgi:hypothetical protein